MFLIVHMCKFIKLYIFISLVNAPCYFNFIKIPIKFLRNKKFILKLSEIFNV